MKRSGRSPWARAAAWGAAAGLVALLTGDGGMTAPPPGIDPLEILNLQVKPNVLFIIDTSSSMQLTPDSNHEPGGDDPKSRFYQAKLAARTVLKANEGRANFGLATFHATPTELQLTDSGPFVYVSADPEANNWLGFFDNIAGFFGNYNDDTSAEIFRSFETTGGGFDSPYPNACVNRASGDTSPMAANHCRYYLRSRLYRNGDLITWSRAAGSAGGTIAHNSATCVTPPADLLSDNEGANTTATTRPCIQIVDTDADPDQTTTYYFSSGTFGYNGAADSCSRTGTIIDVAPCTTTDGNVSSILPKLRNELPLDSNGEPVGVVAATNHLTSACPGAPATRCPNIAGAGIRQGLGTPLGDSLMYARGYYRSTVFPARPAAVQGLQKNFVILLTDGDQSCGVTGAPAGAQALWDNALPVGSPTDRVETLVVAFTQDVSVGNANAIARAGSGGLRDAYTATTLAELVNALNAALGETTASGSFSTESSITESIFEYGVIVPGSVADPANPTTRYNATIPVLLQTSFDMPGYRGHLKGFVNSTISGDADGAGGLGVTSQAPNVAKWDAGQKLKNRVWYGTSGSNGMGDPSAAANWWTFAQLHANAGNAAAPIDSTALSSAKIKRRIYTSPRNGVFKYGNNVVISAEQQPVPIWPPTSAVAPSTDVAGTLDVPLGITTLAVPTMQSTYGACTGSVAGTAFTTALPGHACNNADPLIVEARTRRELREIILAGAAGAEVVRDANGDPSRNAAGDILYRAKTWVMAESTLAVPAVVPVPLEARPITHTGEYVLFRDGPRDASSVNSNSCSVGTYPATNCIAQGFGLRGPDKNAGAAAVSSTTIKPVMSVVYHATNAMVHALRAGPRVCTAGACPGSNEEGGGEELWAFVPYDQLSKLRDRLLPLARDPHVYMNASSIRFADVFVPDPDGNGFQVGTRTFLGRWRTMLYFGRGIGGKHYTALDITSVGPYTIRALDAYPPVLAWSRGNPDTQDASGTANSASNVGGTDLGVNDTTAYATMGQTWSVPALAVVKRDLNYDKEFALFVGSGYSTNPAEGTNFYVMDALTGDVLYKDDVAKLASTGVVATTQTNAIVANPSAFVPSQLAAGFVGNPAASQASLVYVGDLHGRVWKWITTSPSLGLVRVKDYTVDQPIANAVGLLSLGSKPHVFLETGNDNRVDVPPNFFFAGLRDDQADTNPGQDLAVQLFQVSLGSQFTPDLTGYRGTAQPATAFNDQKQGRVFFVGTKYFPATTDCISKFRSAVFALGAQSGQAAYDLSAGSGLQDMFVSVDDRVNAVRGAGGEVILDKAKKDAPPDQLPPSPKPNTGPTGTSGEVFVKSLKATSSVCR